MAYAEEPGKWFVIPAVPIAAHAATSRLGEASAALAELGEEAAAEALDELAGRIHRIYVSRARPGPPSREALIQK